MLSLGNAYRYDQLNRLSEAISFDNLNAATNTWGAGGTGKYQNQFTYDANGNILTQVRKDQNGNAIDQLSYEYKRTDGTYGATGQKVQNRLYNVRDFVTSIYTDDIDDMNPTTQGGQNFAYDAEGRLITDKQEKIDLITWRVDGKVKSVKQSGTNPDFSVSFDYDAMGHRIAKHSYDKNPAFNGGLGKLVKSTYYVLDAQGNTMSVYERVVNPSEASVTYALAETHTYGSSRLGVRNTNVNVLTSMPIAAFDMASVTHRIGDKGYELNNHLGNVLSVISDKPIPHVNGTNVDYYMADIRQATDYSPFGAELYGRSYGSGTNRYGFQGQERDNEIAGKGNSLNFNFRMHSPRLGRFFSIDPLSPKYPHNSPYAFSENKVVSCIELEGLEGIDFKVHWDRNGKAVIRHIKYKWDLIPGFLDGLYINGEYVSDYANGTEALFAGLKLLSTKSYGEFRRNQQDSQEAIEESRRKSEEYGQEIGEMVAYGIYLKKSGGTTLDPVVIRPSLGKLSIQMGKYSSSEVAAARFMRQHAKEVVLRQPKGQRKLEGETSDLLVDGKNYDVYTPTTNNASRIIQRIADKKNQAQGIVLDLSKTKVTEAELGNIMERLQGKGVTTITDVKVMPKP